MNRREFLKGLGAALAVAVLPRVRRVELGPPERVGEWHHFGAVWRNDAMREVYLDGKGGRVNTMRVQIGMSDGRVVEIPGWGGDTIVWRNERVCTGTLCGGAFTWEVSNA